MTEVDVCFIRHAECVENTITQTIGGRSNHSPLTELGNQQAESAGPLIVETVGRPDIVFASPAVRTLQTARLALKSAGLSRYVFVDDDLQEMSQGQAEGRLRTEVYTPDVLESIERLGKDFKNSGGESPNDVTKRMSNWLDRAYDEIIKDFGTAYVFSHGYAIRCLVGNILGWDHKQIYQAQTPNTSMTLLRGKPGAWAVEFFAKTC